MRRLIRLAAQLYPASWRRRYGVEFAALLEDVAPHWRDALDVLGGAIKMQMSMSGFRNIVVAGGLVGLVIAAGLAFTLPNQYVSRALLRVTPSQIPEDLVPAAYNQQMADHINLMWQTVASRASLSELIQRPSLNLYKSERARKPLEDVIEQMKADIRIEILAAKSGTKPSSAFFVAFNYPDPIVAQEVTNALVTKFVDANFKSSVAGITSEVVDLLDPASLPQKPIAPNRWQILVIGLGLGLLAGILTVGIRRLPLVAASGLAGLILAWAASYLIPNTYRSHALLRINSPQKISGLTERVISDQFLKTVVAQENLYNSARSGASIDEIVRTMRTRDLAIETINRASDSHPTALAISFRYTDRLKAQHVVIDIANALFVEANQHDPSAAPSRPLELLDAASYPETPIAPHRTPIAAAGMGLGLLFASIALWVKRRRSATLNPAQG